jgi:hypothetical protein
MAATLNSRDKAECIYSGCEYPQGRCINLCPSPPDTPRTNEEAFRPCRDCVRDKIKVVPASFARRLERELIAARKRIKREKE